MRVDQKYLSLINIDELILDKEDQIRHHKEQGNDATAAYLTTVKEALEAAVAHIESALVVARPNLATAMDDPIH